MRTEAWRGAARLSRLRGAHLSAHLLRATRHRHVPPAVSRLPSPCRFVCRPVPSRPSRSHSAKRPQTNCYTQKNTFLLSDSDLKCAALRFTLLHLMFADRAISRRDAIARVPCCVRVLVQYTTVLLFRLHVTRYMKCSARVVAMFARSIRPAIIGIG